MKHPGEFSHIQNGWRPMRTMSCPMDESTFEFLEEWAEALGIVVGGDKYWISRVVDGYIKHLKSRPCADCGKKYPPQVMDFDHVTGEKFFGVSRWKNDRQVRRKTRPNVVEVLEEVKKCEVVCSNCHRIRTFNCEVKDGPQ